LRMLRTCTKQVISLRGVQKAGLTIDQVIRKHEEGTSVKDSCCGDTITESIDISDTTSAYTYASTVDEFIDASRTSLIAELNAFVDYYSEKLGNKWRNVVSDREDELEELRQRYASRRHTCECPSDTLHIDLKNFLDSLKESYEIFIRDHICQEKSDLLDDIEIEKMICIEVLHRETMIRQYFMEVEERLMFEKIERANLLRLEHIDRITGLLRDSGRLEEALEKPTTLQRMESDLRHRYEVADRSLQCSWEAAIDRIVS
jgi:hypothetical protein